MPDGHPGQRTPWCQQQEAGIRAACGSCSSMEATQRPWRLSEASGDLRPELHAGVWPAAQLEW